MASETRCTQREPPKARQTRRRPLGPPTAAARRSARPHRAGALQPAGPADGAPRAAHAAAAGAGRRRGVFFRRGRRGGVHVEAADLNMALWRSRTLLFVEPLEHLERKMLFGILFF